MLGVQWQAMVGLERLPIGGYETCCRQWRNSLDFIRLPLGPHSLIRPPGWQVFLF
jgi:hypothetical protein